MTHSFTHKGARSIPLLLVFTGLIIVETVVIHILLMRFNVYVAYSLSFLSLTALAWLVADFVAFGQRTTQINNHCLNLRLGKRVATTVPLERIVSVTTPTWTDLSSSKLINGTKPAAPNVLITLNEPLRINLLGSLNVTAEQLAFHVDEPYDFVSTLEAAAKNRQNRL